MSYDPSNAAVGGWFRVLTFYPIKMTSESICGTHILPRVYYVNSVRSNRGIMDLKTENILIIYWILLAFLS